MEIGARTVSKKKYNQSIIIVFSKIELLSFLILMSLISDFIYNTFFY